MNYQNIKNLKYSNTKILVIIYFSFLLDNTLLTVVVPIIPDYLFHQDIIEEEVKSNITINHHHPQSLSPLQKKYEDLEKDNFPLGALLASKAFVQLLVTPFVGHITNTFGYFIPLLVGSCNLILASLLFAFGSSYGILIFSRALHGIASSAISVCSMCILAEIFSPEERTKLMPFAFGGAATGVLLGYPLGGAAYFYLGKASPFLLIAFFTTLVVGIEILLFMNQTYEPIDRQHYKHNNTDTIGLLRNVSIMIVVICICTVTTSIAVLESCLPLYLLQKMEKVSKWQLGAVFIPDSIGYFFGSHFGGMLGVESWRLALSGVVLTGISCCGIPLANSFHQLILPHFGLGLGVGLVDSALVPLLADLIENNKTTHGNYGTVYTLQQISVNLAYSFGPLLGGEAVRLMGFPKLMGIVGLTNIFICPFLVELEYRQHT